MRSSILSLLFCSSALAQLSSVVSNVTLSPSDPSYYSRLGLHRAPKRSLALQQRAHAHKRAAGSPQCHKKGKPMAAGGRSKGMSTQRVAAGAAAKQTPKMAAPVKAAGSLSPAAKNGGSSQVVASSKQSGCFPGSALTIPPGKASAGALSKWWCDESSEYAFLGFSYDQTPCQSASQLAADFGQMRSQFGARYVRMYGNCDSADYLNNVVEAAAQAKIGVMPIVWFGYDGGNAWQGRMANIVKVMNSNQKAPYVIRTIAVGSEALFDHVLSEPELAQQINGLRDQLSAYGTQVSTSDMPYGYQSNGDAPDVFKAVDIAMINTLPFFDSQATTGSNSWGFVAWTISYIQQHAPGKLIRIAQTGWPSNTNVWKANVASAVASVSSESAYFGVLDAHCADLKSMHVGWFAQIWSDSMLDGWGILNSGGSTKFDFKPRTSC